jgi:hypothetical protein
MGLALLTAAMLAASPADPHAPSVMSLPPVVISTEPRSGDAAVDPAAREIKVTFSKDMMTDRMWSFVQLTKGAFPVTRGEPHFADRRTIVLPVELAPGKAYAIWLNQGRFDHFRDAGGHAAVPYLLVFETRQR